MEDRTLAEHNDPDRPDDPYRPNGREQYDPVEDMGDVLQDQEYDAGMVVVPVCVKEPVRTQELPTTSGGSRRYDLTATETVRVLTADPRRRRALIQATGDDNVCLASTQADAAGPFCASFQSFTLLEITSCDELWARAESTTLTLNILNEQWAE